MGGNNQPFKPPRLLVWSSRAIFLLGLIMVVAGVFVGLMKLFHPDGSILEGLEIFLSLPGLGTCKFGIEIGKGKRWTIFFLLIFILFGSIVSGFLSMVGQETNIGYYIWGIGALLSGAIIIFLKVYWEKLLDD